MTPILPGGWAGVVERRHMRLLGDERDVGPWLLSRIVRRSTGAVNFVPWSQIDSLDSLDNGEAHGTAHELEG